MRALLLWSLLVAAIVSANGWLILAEREAQHEREEAVQ